MDGMPVGAAVEVLVEYVGNLAGSVQTIVASLAELAEAVGRLNSIVKTNEQRLADLERRFDTRVGGSDE